MSLALKAANLNTPQSLGCYELWANLLPNEPGTEAALQPFINLLNSGTPFEELAMMAASTTQNINSINLVGLTNSG
jgi:hypothetical protein